MVFSEISSEARDHFGYHGFQANLKEFVAKGIPHLQKTQVRDFRKRFLLAKVLSN
jgi:hypothetical protein